MITFNWRLASIKNIISRAKKIPPQYLLLTMGILLLLTVGIYGAIDSVRPYILSFGGVIAVSTFILSTEQSRERSAVDIVHRFDEQTTFQRRIAFKIARSLPPSKIQSVYETCPSKPGPIIKDEKTIKLIDYFQNISPLCVHEEDQGTGKAEIANGIWLDLSTREALRLEWEGYLHSLEEVFTARRKASTKTSSIDEVFFGIIDYEETIEALLEGRREKLGVLVSGLEELKKKKEKFES